MNGHEDMYRDLESYRDEGHLVHLDVDECLRLIAGRHVGRIAISEPGGPLVFPVNYVVDDGTVLFRTGVGSKLGAADQLEEVAFQVDHVDVAQRSGWSVLVRGRLVEVVDGDEVDRLVELPLHAFAGGDRDHYVRVLPRAISGRRIPIPDDLPSSWLVGDDDPWGDGDDQAGA